MQDKPYCLMPFIHLHVTNRGMVNACCVANIPFGNVNEQSFEDIWQGEAINLLRKKFLRGEQDNRCATCHNIEVAGGVSIRQETFEKYGETFDLSKTDHPVYFDIRFSNVCNFRCRTCWHGASSKWFADAKVLGTNIGQQAIIKNIDDFEDFTRKFGDVLLTAKEFYFAGGEPLVTEEHYLLLLWLIEHEVTSITLRYNTNFSKLSFKQYDVIELWKKFEKVEILASIDAHGALGEYIRKDLVWKDIIKNRSKIRDSQNVEFKIAPTISCLNVFVIPDLYQEALALDLISPENLYINMLERPNYYNIQILPQQKKDAIAEKYLSSFSASTPIKIRKAFQGIIDYMYDKDRSDIWPQFLKKTMELDQLRGEDYLGFESLKALLNDVDPAK